MKKLIGCLMLGIFLATLYAVPTLAVEGFNDLDSEHWAKEYVQDLVDREVINGYPDGSFKPEGTITTEEFIKTAITSLGFTNLKVDKEDWSKVYIDKAIETGLVVEGDFSNYSKDINRAEMARIIARCMEYNKEEFQDRDKYKNAIEDYDIIGTEFNDYVLKAYSKGIITGYPDGTFGAYKNATRAEACTMIYKLIHKDARTVVEIQKKRASIDDVIIDVKVYAYDPEEYHAYFYVSAKLNFDKDINEPVESGEFRGRITCTNLPEYNTFEPYVYEYRTTVVRDKWHDYGTASYYINRTITGKDRQIPVVIEPGTKFEFIYTIEDLVTGEKRDYPISLVTK